MRELITIIKNIEFKYINNQIKKINEFKLRIIETMKILELHQRIMKIINNL